MRKIGIVLVLFLSFVGVLVPVSAQDGITATPAGEAVTVRSGPGVEYSVRGTLMPEFSLTVSGRTDFGADFACSGDPVLDNAAWLRVDVVEGVEGWISYCAVEVTGDVLAIPLAEPAFPVLQADLVDVPVLTADGWEPSDPFFGAMLATSVLVYQYPTLGSEILGIIEFDSVVELLAVADTGSWYQIQFGEVTGWVPSYLMLVGNDQEAELPVINLEEFFADLLGESIGDGEGCDNPPPDWASAWGWRERCQGLGKGEYEPVPPPGHAGDAISTQ